MSKISKISDLVGENSILDSELSSISINIKNAIRNGA
jgi:hypothetical protein